MKLVKQVIIFLITITAITAGTLLFIAYKYEDQLKQNAIKAINKQLTTEINVKTISVDAFKKFPYISIKLENTLAYDAVIKVNNKDTLFYFDEVFLQFNVLDIIKQTYTMREISLENGIINVKTDKKGEKNYIIFNSNKETKEDQIIKLERVFLNNVIINYINEQRNDNIRFKASKTYLKGEFQSTTYDMDIYGNLDVDYIIVSNQKYFDDKNTLLDLRLYIDTKSNTYKFTRGNLTVNDHLDFDITGSIKNNDETNYDIKITGEKLNIIHASVLLPKNVSNYLNDYKSNGILNFYSTITGEASKNKTPEINVNFNVQNGELKEKNYNLAFEQLNFKGNYNNKGIFSITDLTAKVNDGDISGNFYIENFNRPKVTLQCETKLTAQDLVSIFKMDTIQSVSGDIIINADISGNVKDLNHITYNDFERMTSKGNVVLSDLNFQLKEDKNNHTAINGTLKLNGNDVLIENLIGNINSSDYMLNGQFENAISYLFLPKQTVGITAVVSSKFVDLNEFVSNGEQSSEYNLKLPDNIIIDLNASIDSLVFRKFYATNMHSDISMKNKQVILHPFSMNCVGGKIEGNAYLSASHLDKIKLKTNCTLNDIRISRLFYEFENFGQNTLTSEHLSGLTNANIEFAMQMDSALNINQQSIISNINIDINNGELIQFKPLIESASYIKENKIIAAVVKPDELAKRLEHIKFYKLSNKINIENRTIFIPKMNVQSSAMDIVLEGKHSFDNDIDYNMNFYLSDLLTQEESARNEKGKTRIFIHMFGNIDNLQFEYDKASAKEGIKQEVKNEKQEVKSILKEELGLFGKDTTVKNTYTPPEKLDFKIEWEEEEPIKKDTTPKRDEKKGIKGLLKSEEKEKTNTEDFDFEDGDL